MTLKDYDVISTEMLAMASGGMRIDDVGASNSGKNTCSVVLHVSPTHAVLKTQTATDEKNDNKATNVGLSPTWTHSPHAPVLSE